MIGRILRKFVECNVAASRAFDRLLPQDLTVDGNRFFMDSFYVRHLESACTVFDIGGGRHPAIAPAQKRQFELSVTGVDISAEELAGAPSGAYDQVVCTDITTYRGDGSADLVLCQSLLEHVPSTDSAFGAIASILKPGGTALLFCPSRNALFARLNLLLPERVKRAILFAVFPAARGSQGFRSYYDHCTPLDFERMAAAHGLEVLERHLFYSSSYFSFLLPVHVVWRAWIILYRAVSPVQSAETFVYALRRTDPLSPGI